MDEDDYDDEDGDNCDDGWDKDDDEESDEGIDSAVKDKAEEVVEESDHFMFFTEIAEAVAPIIDELFPIEDGVRVIGEPGRYFVAAAATLVASVLGTRSNEVDEGIGLW